MNLAGQISLDTIKEELIKDYNEGAMMVELAKKYSIGLSSVSVAFKRWGIQARKKNRWARVEREYSKEQILDMYVNQKMNIVQIKKVTGYDRTTIKNWLTHQNFEQRSHSLNQRKYNVNENYFKNIDTQDKAYWLGFLYADGCNKENIREIQLNLSRNDRCVIEAFKAELETDAPIDDYTDSRGFHYSDIRIYNQKMSQDLAKHGCVQAKTLILTFPKIKDELLPSFLLSYFDGDGCVSKSKTSDIFEIAGTEAFLLGYQEVLMRECGLNKTKLAPRKNISILRYGGKLQLQKIYNYLYQHQGWKLQRKHDKFKAILDQPNPSPPASK